jgi:DNA-binding transcriptional ArsR family regulator
MQAPRYIWDIGTAYDMFSSLNVLHNPDKYALRPAWAAGMRSRLPSDDREFLEEINRVYLLNPSFAWIHNLPSPKDGATVIRVMGQIAPRDRLLAIMAPRELPQAGKDVFEEVKVRGSWDEADLEAIKTILQGRLRGYYQVLPGILEWCARSEEYGDHLLSALESYYEVFFEEEEKRILPALEETLDHAQTMAEKHSWLELIRELSQGVHYDALIDALPEQPTELLLVPSYWSTPIVSYGMVSEECVIIVFGARPADASLVPGEVVPDTLLHALRALSDPTRLRILRYLVEEPLTPGQLARRLRLRGPTVIHHLNTLRMATLVELSGVGKETIYAIRAGAIPVMYTSLKSFLEYDEEQ